MLFDALKGASSPAVDLGDRLSPSDSEAALRNFHAVAATAAARISKQFGVQFISGNESEILDRISQEMWAEDWSPESGNVRLFATDFGAVFANALLDLPGAEPVLRSLRDLSEFSVWFSGARVEYFPFHKAQKALTVRDGESFTQMYRDACGSSAAA